MADLLLLGVGVAGLGEEGLGGLDGVGLLSSVVRGVGLEVGDQALVEGGAGHCEGALEKVDGDRCPRGKEGGRCEGGSGACGAKGVSSWDW